MSRLLSPEHEWEWINPLKLVVSPNSGVTGNLYCGLMEFEEMMFALHFLNSDSCFVDVGANNGTYALLASGLAGAKSIAFEPVPTTFDKLCMQVKINRLEEHVICINKAVGDKRGILKLSNGRQDCVNHVVCSEEDCVSVESTTLDESLDVVPELLKVDIEGYEWYALQGAKRILAHERLKAIILEVNHQANRFDVTPSMIHGILISCGFQSYQYEPFSRNLYEAPMATDGNTIWVRDAISVQEMLRESDHYRIMNVTV